MPVIQYEWEITPVPEPRMSRSDRWKERPPVMRYFAFRDQIRLLLNSAPELKEEIEAGRLCKFDFDFFLPMPNSWSKKKKLAMVGKYHRQKPDKDNLEKALIDSLFGDLSDEGVADTHSRKFWAYEGRIIIKL